MISCFSCCVLGGGIFGEFGGFGKFGESRIIGSGSRSSDNPEISGRNGSGFGVN